MSTRNLSMLDYLAQLQLEYLLFELRLKIYPKSDDKNRFKKILTYKKEKIEDICNKNTLDNIFNNNEILSEVSNDFYNEFGNPKDLNKRDQYFYFWIGSDFSYKGKGVKLLSYDLNNQLCKIKDGNNNILENIDLNVIKRVL